MPITTLSFRGGQAEQRDYPAGSNIQDFMQNMTGAKAMQGSISKGLDSDEPPGTMPTPPRSLWSAEIGAGVIGDAKHPLVAWPAGDLHANEASSGEGGPGKLMTGMGGERAPLKTGISEGAKVVKTYGPGGVGGPVGLTTPGGNLGISTRSRRQERR